jgi:hypothetical protein
VIKSTVTRSNTLTNGLSKLRERVAQRVERGLLAVGEKVLEVSRELVPKDTLALLNSSGIRMEASATDLKVVVFYGRRGDHAIEYSQREGRVVIRIPYNYAVYVHEDRTTVHWNGQYDFLRSATLDLLGLQQALRDALAQTP